MKYGTIPLLLILVLALAGCTAPCQNNLPPATMLMHPGPGVDGPGPGVMQFNPMGPAPGQASQIAFVGPEGMAIRWDVSAPGRFDSQPLVAPARQDFTQAAIYRLKLTDIPGRPGVELYPTLEVAPALPRTEAFLAHNAVPIQFTPEDLDQVLNGNFVTKVIYLPDPEFQELAVAGVETLVSTRLDPGVDPIVEADRRGSILAVLRLGNKDLEIPGQATDSGDVMPVSYVEACPEDGASSAPRGMPVGGGGPAPQNYIAGVTGPQYGMPMSGTPIGLAGPPHVPLGGPAGLQRHVIRNHTCTCIPEPTKRVKIDVRQEPGFCYPKPANHAYIVEETCPGAALFRQPLDNQCQVMTPAYDAGCEMAAPECGAVMAEPPMATSCQ